MWDVGPYLFQSSQRNGSAWFLPAWCCCRLAQHGSWDNTQCWQSLASNTVQLRGPTTPINSLASASSLGGPASLLMQKLCSDEPQNQLLPQARGSSSFCVLPIGAHFQLQKIAGGLTSSSQMILDFSNESAYFRSLEEFTKIQPTAHKISFTLSP